MRVQLGILSSGPDSRWTSVLDPVPKVYSYVEEWAKIHRAGGS